MTTLIKNGRIITATDDYIADVFIDGETVKMIGKDLPVRADKTLDATGKLVIPGSIDWPSSAGVSVTSPLVI